MNRKRFNQFGGPLKPPEVAEGIDAAIENARALGADAKLLLEAGRVARAAALAALSVEESGKGRVLRALSLAWSPEEAKEEWKRYRKHASKNVTWISRALLGNECW